MTNAFTKKKLLLVVGAVILVAALIALTLWLVLRDNESPRLLVNDKRVRTEHVTINESGTATLPLVAVIEALGYEVEWKDENTCTWTAASKLYTLSISERTLYEDGKTDLLAPARAADTLPYSCEAVEGDVVVDNITLWSILLRMDHDLLVYVHFNENRVTVEKKGDH